MTEATARALARRARETTDPATLAGIHAAMSAGGYDPDATEPDNPQGYNERAVSTAMAVHPGYLRDRELHAMQEAHEAALGGEPF